MKCEFTRKKNSRVKCKLTAIQMVIYFSFHPLHLKNFSQFKVTLPYEYSRHALKVSLWQCFSEGSDPTGRQSTSTISLPAAEDLGRDYFFMIGHNASS